MHINYAWQPATRWDDDGDDGDDDMALTTRAPDVNNTATSPELSSPHPSIALAMVLDRGLHHTWISAARAHVAVTMHRIADVIFCATHIALHRSIALVPSKARIARFTSWVAKTHHIADLHRALWRT